MTDEQNGLFQMFSACNQVYNANETALTAFTPFNGPYQKFLSRYNDLPTLIQQQGMKTTGVTANKNAVEETLLKKADKLMIALRALAAVTHDFSLKVVAEITHSRLTHSSDAEVVGLAGQVHDAADANVTALAAYGITPSDVADLATAISDFQEQLGKPRTALEIPKEATAKLRNHFAECRALLSNEMDPAIEAYGISHPDIASAWKNARRIIINGGKHLSMMIQVTDAATGQPISDVDIDIMPDKVEKKTGEKGGCDVAHLADGNKKVTASKAEYATISVDAGVTSGETEQLHIIMHKL